jgi:two-component system, cell cycle sensor histidine kinase and response regulator CckA
MTTTADPELRQLLDDYLRMYAGRDDDLTGFFSEDFSGFTGGGDFLVKDRAEWVAITRQDFAQVTEPIRLELVDSTIQSLAATVAVATSFFRIHLPIKDHFLSRRMARLVLVFRKEAAGWKICHSGISLPEASVREGEVYPMQELQERTRSLENLVAEQTALLAVGNEQLRRANQALSTEVVEHRQAEAALLVSEERLHSALAGSQQVTWEQNPLSGVRGVEQGLDGDRWRAAIHPDDRARVVAASGRCFAGEMATFEEEFRVAQPDGGWRWLWVAGRLDRTDAQGRPVRVIGVMMDVTPVHLLRARAVSVERLAATGTLARGMAHEINNPLACVVSNLQYVREQLASAAGEARAGAPVDAAAILRDADQALRDAIESAKRIRDIVTDLRTIALGDISEVPASSTLADGVRDARRVAGQDLARCSSVEVDVPPVSGLTITHPDLVQLLAHLLINAGQATSMQPNHVRVDGAVRDPGHVELRISDTGAGMTDVTMARAFEPFFTTREIGKGRGLGLSVCRGIAEAVGGEIRLASRPGEGTTVTVVLPRVAVG